MKTGSRTAWTFVITSVALFMVTLDNLVVTMALPVIREDLNASLAQLEWTVNAYTLTFAVFLLTGAALGDRFGRKRMFVDRNRGSSRSPRPPRRSRRASRRSSIARAIQGLGGAMVTPLTLTLLSAAVPAEKRGLALGAWGGIGGLAVALGPVVGGAIVEGISWQWIFWLNVPIGLVLVPLACRRLTESRGPDSALDLPGVALVSAGLFGIVWGLVRANGAGWTSPEMHRLLRGRGDSAGCVRRLGASIADADAADAVLQATGRSRPRMRRPCSCSSGCSARSSCSRSSSRPCRATHRSTQACARCRGRRCRCSSRRSPGRSRTESAADR